jgi:histidine triad (HIT) family protein
MMHDVVDPGCVFCRIVRGLEHANIVWHWPSAIAFRPLNPVTKGHVLVVPRSHVPDFRTDPVVSGETMRCAAELAKLYWPDGKAVNLITSSGAEATQTVFHLHIHLVPRRAGDGLQLPWTPQQLEETA